MSKLQIWLLVIGLMVVAGIMLRLHRRRNHLRRHGAVRLGSKMGRNRGAEPDTPPLEPADESCGEVRVHPGGRPAASAGGADGAGAKSGNGAVNGAGSVMQDDIPMLINAVDLPSMRNKEQPGPDPVTLALYLRADEPFAGAALLGALSGQDMLFGEHQMFHRYAGTSRDAPLFSIARMSEPGTFDKDSIATDTFGGLCLFMVLRQGDDNIARLEQMIGTAAALQDALGGTLMDEERQPVDEGSPDRYRDIVRVFDGN